MKNVILTLIIILSVSGIFAQQSHPDFGDYYEIDPYGIFAPFHDTPYGVRDSNPIFKSTSVQYAYPSPTDDLNYMYGVEICEFTVTTDFKDVSERLDFYAKSVEQRYALSAQARLLKNEKSGSGESYSVLQKFELTIEGVGPAVITSLFTIHKGLIVRRYVISPPNNQDNSRVEAFFSALRIL